MTIAFDTLGYAKALRANGVDETIAEAHAEAARDFIMKELVTKTDLEAALAAQTFRLGAIVAGVAGILFALLRLTG